MASSSISICINTESFLELKIGTLRMFDFFTYRKNYTDADITFYVQVYKDFSLATKCLTHLRRVYPRARIIILSDGDDDTRHQGFESLFQAEYYRDSRMYNVACGGDMLQRMLKIFLLKPTDYLIKIDTDTRIDRRFKYLPREQALYGMYAKKKHRVLQGGAVIIPLGCAQKIYHSKLLLSETLKSDPKNTWGRYLSDELYNERVYEWGMIGFEWVLKWVCDQIKINMKEFKEIYTTWKLPCANEDLKYAIVHPDKELKI